MINEFNFLGLTINEHMDWTSHSNKISNKIARTIGVMKKIKSFIPASILKLMYNSLILPHLYFCITAWGFNANRIVKLQKKAIRTISNSKFNAHTEPLFKELRLLKISDIFNLQCLKFYFNVTHRQTPVFFFTFFIQNNTVHSHETRKRHHIHITGTHTTTAKHRIRKYIPKLLTNTRTLITDKISTHSHSGFTRYIPNYFLNTYKSECTIINCFICSRVLILTQVNHCLLSVFT